MNETLFFLHLFLSIGFAFGALKLGKEALVTWIALQAVLANLFVLKQMVFFGFHVTCSDVYIIGSVLGLNLLQEYFGRESAKKALWICFFTMSFFVVMAKMHLLYIPSADDGTQGAFLTLLSPSPRLLAASLGVFFLVQQIDLRFFALLKKEWKAPLWLRNGTSLVLSQGLDTVLFSFLGLWGLVESLSDIIMVSFAIKLLIIAAISPLIAFIKRRVPA